MKTTAKDFKMTELGPIPKDWEVKRLGDCCSITTGHKDVNEGCENGHFPFFTCSRDVYRANCYSFDGEAILVAGNGDVGNLHYCNGKFEAYQRTYVLMNFKIDTQYLWCELGANLMERLTDGKIGTSIPYIVLGQLQDYMFALPPLPEQRRIAAALSDVDEMISALEKLVEKKRKIKTGAMQRLLTAKTRLPGFKGAWVEKRLGEIGETYNGIGGKTKDDFGRGPARYITFLNVLTKPVLDERLFEPVNVLPADGQNRAKKGDLFFNTSSETPEEVGICSMLATDQTELYLNSFCFGFRLFDDNVSPLFLSYYFRSADGRLLMTTLAQGSTRYNLSKESFKDACIVIPPTLDEQKAIAKMLGDMDEEIAAQEAELAKTRQLKQGMMQELLTGKTRLI